MDRVCVFFLLFNFCCFHSFGQTLNSKKNFIEGYFSSLRNHVPLYQGEILLERFTQLQHPYFHSNSWLRGNISFKNVLYTDVFIRYNTELDEVFVSFDQVFGIKVMKSDIQFFNFRDLKGDFVRIKKNEEDLFLRRERFGKRFLFTDYNKQRIKVIEYGRSKNTFEESAKYFFEKDGNMAVIKKTSVLADALSMSKKDLYQILQRERLSFRDNKGKAIRVLLEKSIDE